LWLKKLKTKKKTKKEKKRNSHSNNQELLYTEEYAQLYLNYLLAVVFKEVFRAKEKNLAKVQNYPKERAETTTNELVIKTKIDVIIKKLSQISSIPVDRLFKILPVQQQLQVLGYVPTEFSGVVCKNDVQLELLWMTNRIMNKNFNYKVSIVPKKLENINLVMFDNLGKKSHDVIKRLIVETKDWDIDNNEKIWFFENYFSFSDLVTVCCKNSLNINYAHQFIQNPYLTSLFGGLHDTFSLLTINKLKDKSLSDLLNEADQDGNTALHMAVMAKDLDLVKLLVEYGASIKINKYNTTPVQIAQKKKFVNIYSFFGRFLSFLNAPNFAGRR